MSNYFERLMKFSCWNINGFEYNINGVKSNKLDDQKVINCLSKSNLWV